MQSDRRFQSRIQEPVSRRSFVVSSAAVATAAAATAVLGERAIAHQGHSEATAIASPEASPLASTLDRSQILELSNRLVGGGNLADNAVDGLSELLAVEPGIEATLAELAAVSEFTTDALAAASPEARSVSANILQYWYLGRYNGEPVPNRADIFFSLVSWQALPYATQPTLCKSFGYWATEIKL